MGIITKIGDLVFQDVKNENETKKAAVVLRVNSLLMGLYFISVAVVLGVTGTKQFSWLCIICVMAYSLSFYLTYMNHTKFAIAFAQLLTLTCIIGFVMELGWDCGIQHFIFTLLVLNFTTSYASMNRKVLIAVGLCAVRLGLYFYTKYIGAQWEVTESAGIALQIVNTVYMFITMVAALAFFSKDSMEMEKKLMQYNDKMHHLASVDPLTGLYNRRSMKEYLATQEQQYQEGNGSNLSIALGDIDFFKKINDTYGHDCGDIVLKYLADLFSRYMEERGRVCRWGGEEFLFVFYDCNGDDAYVLLDNMLSQVRKSTIEYNDQKIKVTLTFGLEEVNFRKGIESGINEADQKLYIGKNEGRNRIIY